MLFMHVSDAVHPMPHIPQFASSLVVSVQPVPQHVSPASQSSPWQLHMPPLQVSLGPHCMPHEPQFCGSLSRFWQPELTQHVSELPHAGPKLQPHVPSEHVSALGWEHVLLQVPQWVALLATSTQKPPQHIWSAVQKLHWPPPPPPSELVFAASAESSPPPALEHPGMASIKQAPNNRYNIRDVRIDSSYREELSRAP
jgi:hypothetical protein